MVTHGTCHNRHGHRQSLSRQDRSGYDRRDRYDGFCEAVRGTEIFARDRVKMEGAVDDQGRDGIYGRQPV